MAPSYNVVWKSTADFRKFDISVPKFSFGNDTNSGFVDFDGANQTFNDVIRLVETPGAASNNAFFSGGFTRTGQTLTGGDVLAYADFNASGGLNGYILPMIIPLSVTQANAAMDTPSIADDAAFLRLLLSGDDAIRLSGGASGGVTHDYVFSGKGNDLIEGNKGNDTLLGEAGQDDLIGGAGADWLYGGSVSDFLDGGAGNDRLYGGSGGNSYYGGSGADTIFGGGQDESIVGGNGNDRIIGGGGNDQLYGDIFGGGGTGADQFTFRKNAGHDYINDFQDGIDKIRIEAPAGTNVGNFQKTNISGGCVITNTTLNIKITLYGVSKNQITLADDFLLIPL